MNEITIGDKVYRTGDIITIAKIYVPSSEWSGGETLTVEGQITGIGGKVVSFTDSSGERGRMNREKFITLNA